MMAKFKQALKSWFVPGTENDHKPHILRNKAILTFAIILLCLKLATFGFFLCFPKSAYFSPITTNRLVELTNQSRTANGLPSLTVNDKLTQSAYFKAQHMLNENYFAHASPQGITPWYWFKQAGYNYRYAGENLAIDFVDAETLHQTWLDSPAHRANILNANYKEMSIAVLTGEFNGKKTTVVVQHFGVQFEKPIKLVETPTEPTQSQPEQPMPETPVPTFAELEKGNLASERKVETEPILAPGEERLETHIINTTQEKIKEFKKFAADIQTKKGPRVLAVLVEKSDQITEEVYIFALLFIGLALLLNIFIKFEVQHQSLIVNCLLIIVLIIILIVIGNKSLPNIGLDII